MSQSCSTYNCVRAHVPILEFTEFNDFTEFTRKARMFNYARTTGTPS